jgi:hypothetical protein
VSVVLLPDNTTVLEATEPAAHRPRVSRETRRLLMTALLAVLTLWTLARLRFPDRPPIANPVPPILGQLTEPPSFADLAARVAEIRGSLSDSLVALTFARDEADGGVASAPPPVPGLRIRDDLAVTVVAPAIREAQPPRPAVVAADRASGLTLVSTSMTTRPTLPIFWIPRELDRPRYVFASAMSPGGVTLRPAYVGSLTPVQIPQWTDDVWALPADAALTTGTVLFTEQDELVGIVAAYEGGRAVVPSRALLAAAERLLEAPQKTPADAGIDVDSLTPRLAKATGADSGVVVTWVNPDGSAAALLRAGDVIASVDGVAIATPEQWRVRAARASGGDTLALVVTRAGAQQTVQLAVPPAAAPPETSASRLGLTMRTDARVGAEVTRVERGSAGDAAGIAAGDLVTAIGSIDAPTPAQVRAAFASLARGDSVIVAVRRGGAHRVTAIQR